MITIQCKKTGEIVNYSDSLRKELISQVSSVTRSNLVTLRASKNTMLQVIKAQEERNELNEEDIKEFWLRSLTYNTLRRNVKKMLSEYARVRKNKDKQVLPVSFITVGKALDTVNVEIVE